MTERGYAMTERGYAMTERRYAMTERGHAMTERGHAMTECGHAMTEREHGMGFALEKVPASKSERLASESTAEGPNQGCAGGGQMYRRFGRSVALRV